ncbi:MAG: hypothetical protein HQL37_09960 [Alphaproteobacteria bacterium]|nr:hypothetical protein [Alphaproteobacteria bacterium]
MHLVVVLAAHEVDSVGDVYFDNTGVSLDGDGAATSAPYARAGTVYANVWKHLGSPDQNADAVLVANTNGEWTNAHRLQGRAYLHLQLRRDDTAFPGGLPNVSAWVRGRRLYDPRTGTTAWSDNAALAILDYLRAPFGLNCSLDEIDLSSFIAAANICDEAVERPGGQEPRYTANGVIDLNQAPVDTVPKLLTACAGRLTYTAGTWRLYAGAWLPPLAEAGEADLRDPVTVRPRRSRRELINTVRGSFLSAASDGQPTDYPPVTVAGYRSEDGDLEVARSLDLPFTDSPYMAQRIARIVLEANRRQLSVEFPANLAGLRFAAGQTVAVTLPRFGLVEQPMVVSSWKMADTMGVDLTLIEDDPDIYEFAVGDLTVTEAAPALSLPANADIPPAMPTGLTATASGTTVLLTWTQQAESDFDHFEVWEAASFTGDPASDASRLTETWQADWQRTGLPAGAARYWWVRAVDRHGNRSPFSAPATLILPGTPSYALLLE